MAETVCLRMQPFLSQGAIVEISNAGVEPWLWVLLA